MVLGLEDINAPLNWIFPAHPKKDAGLSEKSPDINLVFMSRQDGEQVDKHILKWIFQYYLVKFLGALSA